MSDLAKPTAEVRISGNASAPLDDPDQAWVVTLGRVLVFATDESPSEDAPPGVRHLVCEAAEGDLLLGVDASEVGRRWFVVGLADAALRPVDLSSVVAEARNGSDLHTRLESWLGATDPTHTPLAELLAAADPVAALHAQSRRSAAVEVDAGRRQRVVEVARIDAAEAQLAAATETAVDALASVFNWQAYLASRLIDQEDNLVDACRIVADRLGVTVQPPEEEDLVRTDPITAIARA